MSTRPRAHIDESMQAPDGRHTTTWQNRYPHLVPVCGENHRGKVHKCWERAQETSILEEIGKRGYA